MYFRRNKHPHLGCSGGVEVCKVWGGVFLVQSVGGGVVGGGVKVCIGVIQAEKCRQSVGVVAGVGSVGWCGRAGECGRSVVKCGGVDSVSSVKCESGGVKVSVGVMVWKSGSLTCHGSPGCLGVLA